MESYIKKRLISAFVIPLAFGITGCSFFPKEQIADSVELVNETEIKEYVTTTVKKGSKTDREKVECTLKSVHTEDLGFSISGNYLSIIHVSVGSHVKKGDLLASLELGDLEEKKSEFETQQEMKKEEIAHNKRLFVLKQRKAVYLKDEDTRNEFQKELERMLMDIESLEKELEILDKQVEQVKESVNKRCIYASMDGVVTFVKDIDDIGAILKNDCIITISDEEIVYKSITGVKADVQKGQVVSMDIDGVPYDAEITDINEDRGDKIISLKVLDNDKFQAGTLGTIYFEGNGFKDGLYLETRSIFTIDGEQAVYILDDFGLKQVRMIETGVTAGEFTQIIAGLKEGDQVVSL